MLFNTDDEIDVNFIGILFCFNVNILIMIYEWILDIDVIYYMILVYKNILNFYVLFIKF